MDRKREIYIYIEREKKTYTHREKKQKSKKETEREEEGWARTDLRTKAASEVEEARRNALEHRQVRWRWRHKGSRLTEAILKANKRVRSNDLLS